MILLLLALLPQAVDAGSFRIEPAPQRIALAELDDTGKTTILAVSNHEVWIADRKEREPLVLPGSSGLWTVADLQGDGRREFLWLKDGEAIYRLALRGEKLHLHPPTVEGLGGRLPQGANAGDFVRDIDKDGNADLVIPRDAVLHLFFGEGEGQFREGPRVTAGTTLVLETSGGLLNRARRRISIPKIDMRDVTGDGRPDMVVLDGDKIHQYIAGIEGLPDAPTVTVDLAEFRERLPELRFDPGNLSAMSRYIVTDYWSDIDGDGDLDLLVLLGGKVLVFLGGPRGIELAQAEQVLRASGNILLAVALPSGEKQHQDLLLLQMEDISLLDVALMYFRSTTLRMKLLVYSGVGKRKQVFSRRVTERHPLQLKLPSIKTLLKQREADDPMRRQVVRLANLDNDGRSDDLVILGPNGRLEAWLEVVPEDCSCDDVLDVAVQQVLQDEPGNELDIETLSQWVMGRTSLLASLVGDRKPDFSIAPPPRWGEPQTLAMRDMDGDGSDEAVMVHRVEPDADGGRRFVGRVVAFRKR